MDNKRNQIKMICTRDKMFLKFQKEKSPLFRGDLFQKYKDYHNRLVGIIRDSKNQYYIRYFNENLKNSKKIWEGVNQITNLKKKNDLVAILLKLEKESYPSLGRLLMSLTHILVELLRKRVRQSIVYMFDRKDS